MRKTVTNGAPLRAEPAVSEAGQRFRAVHIVQLGGVLVAGFLIRLAFIQSAGYRDDMTIFYRWFTSILTLPPDQIYARIPDFNYPPASVALYELTAQIWRVFVHGAPTEYALNVALKLPAILGDLLGAVVAYAVARRWCTHLPALGAAGFFAFNPALIYDSAFWGQTDSIPTALALLAICLLPTRAALLAWPIITLAVLVKPPVLVLVPLMLLEPFSVSGAQRQTKLRSAAAGIIVAVALIGVFALRYFPHPTIFIALRHLAAQLISGSGFFPFTSLNAFNLWALFEPFFASDKAHIAFFSIHRWASLLFCAIAASIYWRSFTSRSSTALLEAAVLLLLAFFVCLTEMHERYLYYAVAFIGVLLFRRRYRTAALLLSVTFLLNLEYGLTFMYLDDAHATMVDRFEFAPWLVHLCSLTNVGVFLWLVWDYFGFGDPATPIGRRLSFVKLPPLESRSNMHG